MTLNVNGLGAKTILLYESDGFPNSDIGAVEGLEEDCPYEFVYDGNAWICTTITRPNGATIRDVVPIDHGGTGADDAKEACKNISALHAVKLDIPYAGDIYAFDYFIGRITNTAGLRRHTIVFNDVTFGASNVMAHATNCAGQVIKNYGLEFILEDDKYACYADWDTFDIETGAYESTSLDDENIEIYGVIIP